MKTHRLARPKRTDTARTTGVYTGTARGDCRPDRIVKSDAALDTGKIACSAQKTEIVAPPVLTAHRVIACLGGDRTRVERRRAPSPAEDELLLRLRVVGFCGTDLFKLDTGGVAPGMVLGHELVGEVAEYGSRVSGFDVGDRVVVPHHVPCGDCHLCRNGSATMCPAFRENLLEPGGFSELVLVRGRAVRRAARRLPAHLSDEAAVFMEPAACVLRGIHRASLGAAGLAAVLGGGSMGLLHLLVLKASRPGMRVVVVDPVENRCALAKELGAEVACAPGDPAAAEVMKRSGGLGADAVFDTVGGTQTLAAGLGLARPGGTVVLFAHAPSAARADFDINSVFKYERRVLGTYSGGPAEQGEIFDMLVEGRLDPSPLATHRLPLGAFEQGVSLVRQKKALKVLFTPATGGDGGPVP